MMILMNALCIILITISCALSTVMFLHQFQLNSYQIKSHIVHLASSRNRDRVKDDNLLGCEIKALRKANKWVV